MLKNKIDKKFNSLKNIITKNNEKILNIKFTLPKDFNFYNFKNIQFEKLNGIFSYVKKDIIKNSNYLNYSNHTKYNDLNNKLNTFKIINFDFTEVIINNLKKQDLLNKIFNFNEEIFFNNLNKLENNPLFLFHSNYDIFNGINLKSNLDSHCFYLNIKNNKNDKKMITFINNIIEKDNVFYFNNLKEIFEDLKYFYDKNKKLELNIFDIIKEINEKKILLKELSYELLINNNNFLSIHLEHYEKLNNMITIYEYENDLNTYNNNKIKIINLIKEYQTLKLEKEHNIKTIEEQNEILILKKNEINNNNFKIREIKNNQLNKIRKTINIKKNNNKNDYYNSVKVKIIKFKQKLNRLNIEHKEMIKNKINIENKIKDLKVDNPKKEKIIKIKYRNIIQNYDLKINELEEQIDDMIKNINYNNFIIKNQEKTNDFVKEDENYILTETNDILSNLNFEKKEINSTIYSNNNIVNNLKSNIDKIDLNIHKEEINLKNLKKKYNLFLDKYDNYIDQKKKFNQITELLKDIDINKNKIIKNKLNLKNKFFKLKNILNSKQIYKNKYKNLLSECIISIINIKNIFLFLKEYNYEKFTIFKEYFNLTLLKLIDNQREKIIKYNISKNLQNIRIKKYLLLTNEIYKKEINDLSIYYEKMIYLQ